MEKTLLVDLKKKLFIRSALISLGSLDEILEVNDQLSGDEILLEIFKKALKDYEVTEPLILEMPITKEQIQTCTAPNGFCEIKSNFSLYLKCAIPEYRIILVPNAIPSWRIGNSQPSANGYYGFLSGIPQPGAYTPFTEYRRPYLFVGDLGLMIDSFYGTNELIMKGLCSRPIVPDFTKDRKFDPKSEKSAIYYLDVNGGGSSENYFMDLCLVHLLDYIRQLKASIQLPNMPVEVFGNVDSSYQELRARCDQYALQSGWKGSMLYDG